jgi:anti-sigma factor RsiW
MTEDILLAYLDGELSHGERASVQTHLTLCPDCVARLETLRARAGRFSRALAAVDRPPPQIEPALGRTASRLAVPGSLLKAAAALLLIAVGAAAAVPGSPVRRWVEHSVQEVRGLLSGASADAGTGQAASKRAAAAGVAVQTADGAVRVVLIDVHPETVLEVRLVGGDEATVSAAGGRFSTGPGWIEVRGAGPDSVRIALPETARTARVEVHGRTVVEKEGAALNLLSGDSVARTGRELQFRAHP